MGALHDPKNVSNKRPNHDKQGALNEVLVFVLIKTIWLCFKTISFLFTFDDGTQKFTKNVPIKTCRARYTNVRCEGLRRQEARRASPDSGRMTKIRYYLLIIYFAHLLTLQSSNCSGCLDFADFANAAEVTDCSERIELEDFTEMAEAANCPNFSLFLQILLS